MTATEHNGAAPGGIALLLQAVKEKGWVTERPEFRPPVPIPVEHRDEAYAKKAASWCRKALEGKTSDLAAMEPDSGRNIELNNAGLQLYRYVLAGHLDGEQVTEALREAGLACGLSNGEIEATLASAQRGSEKYGPQEPPLRIEEPDPFVGKVDITTGEVGSPPPPDGPAVDYEAFWASRPELEHIRLFARARRCSPWAVLGVVLARIITATPQWVVLPALVGSYASLNLFVALVGPSGGGKGAAESAAGDCIDIRDNSDDEIEVATVGSGEGIGHLYAHREKGEVIRDRHAVLFTVPEVDNLSALGGRQGATLMPQLRSAWSGEKLGFSYADKNKALPIERHTYRMGLVLGVQPGRAAPLLDDADGGTPQRFLWMPVTDPDAPDEAPEVPEPIVWRLRGIWTSDPFAPEAGGIKLTEMPIPDEVRQQVGRASLDRLRAKTDALDGHSMLARLKVAAALALLAGRKAVTMDDWELSATIMAVSTATRESVVTYLSTKAKQANTAKGEAEGMRAVMVAERVAEADVKRVARRVMSKLRSAGGELARHEVRTGIAARDRQYFDEAVERLIEAGTVAVEGVEKGQKVRLVE